VLGFPANNFGGQGQRKSDNSGILPEKTAREISDVRENIRGKDQPASVIPVAFQEGLEWLQMMKHPKWRLYRYLLNEKVD